MKACWNEKPEMRPSFSNLRKLMKEMGEREKVTTPAKHYFLFLIVNSYC